MTKKGFILGVIVLLSEVIWFFYFRYAISTFDIFTAEQHFEKFVKVVVPMGVLIHSPFMIILLTQFSNKRFYKYLGIQILIIGILNIVNTLAFDFYTYQLMSSISLIISIVSMLVLSILALTGERLKIASLYCAIVFINLTFFGRFAFILTERFIRYFDIHNNLLYIMMNTSTYLWHAVSVLSVVLVIYESNENKVKIED